MMISHFLRYIVLWTVIMAASAENVNINSDTPPSQDDNAENDEPKTPSTNKNGQWQTYFADKRPVSQKKRWKSK